MLRIRHLKGPQNHGKDRKTRKQGGTIQFSQLELACIVNISETVVGEDDGLRKDPHCNYGRGNRENNAMIAQASPIDLPGFKPHVALRSPQCRYGSAAFVAQSTILRRKAFQASRIPTEIGLQRSDQVCNLMPELLQNACTRKRGASERAMTGHSSEREPLFTLWLLRHDKHSGGASPKCSSEDIEPGSRNQKEPRFQRIEPLRHPRQWHLGIVPDTVMKRIEPERMACLILNS